MAGNDSSIAPPGQPRKRGPSVAKTAQTRARIFEAALGFFLTDGFEKARMSDIAQAAGLAKGTLYLYFPTKEALFEAVLAETVGTTVRSLQGFDLSNEPSVQAFLRRMVLPFADLLSDPRRTALFRLIIVEGPRFPNLLAAYRRVALDPLMEAVRLLAARARETGELEADALQQLPMLMLSPGILATVWNSLFPDDALEPRATFDAFLRLVFRD
jgi:TetR/AcrR family transcriptional regulator, regulator of autoinduction and epiphytic fitness